MTVTGWDRILIALGAIAGLAGVALSAAAAHVTGAGSLETAARFLLFHAPALLALAALSGTRLVHPGLGRAAGFALVLAWGCSPATSRCAPFRAFRSFPWRRRAAASS